MNKNRKIIFALNSVIAFSFVLQATDFSSSYLDKLSKAHRFDTQINLRAVAKSDIALGFLKYAFMDISNEQIVEIVRESLSSVLGNVWIDTAAAYGEDRKSEKTVGQVLRLLTPPEQARVKVITKFGIQFDPKQPFLLSNEQIEASLKDSIQNIGRAPDIFLVHRFPGDYPSKEITRVMKLLAGFKSEGRVLRIGISEPTLQQLEIANHAAHIDALEITYAPFTRRADLNGIKKFCDLKGIRIFAYGTGLRGFLSDRTVQIEPRTNPIEQLKALGVSDWVLNVGYFQPENIASNLRILQKYLREAKDLGMNANSLAVAWTINNEVTPIIETANMDHLRENLQGRLIQFSDKFKFMDGLNLKGNPNPMMLEYLDSLK